MPLYTESHIVSYKNIVYSIVVKFDILSLNIFPVQIRLLLSYIIEIYQNNDIIFLREARFRNVEFVLPEDHCRRWGQYQCNPFFVFFHKYLFSRSVITFKVSTCANVGGLQNIGFIKQYFDWLINLQGGLLKLRLKVRNVKS